MRLIRILVVLVLLAVAGLAGYAYMGDMTLEPREMRVPVSLTNGPLPDSAPTAAANSSAAVADASQEPADADAPPAEGADVLD